MHLTNNLEIKYSINHNVVRHAMKYLNVSMKRVYVNICTQENEVKLMWVVQEIAL